MNEEQQGRRIGEVAATAGVTTRALHHYESIGLLTPVGRTDAGYRVYDDESVRRIYRICVLRRLGMSLEQIGRALDSDEWRLAEVLQAHLDDVERQLSTAGRLRSSLVHLLAETSADRHPSRDLIEVLAETATLDRAVTRRIQILVYADLEAAIAHLVDVFDLGPGELIRDPDGAPVHGTVEAGDGEIWLHPESDEFRLVSPRSVGAATAMTAVIVDDVDAHYERARDRGADIVYTPVDQPYGYREYSARDPEGGLWSFMKALPEEKTA